jgi:hypothetical protein
MKKLDKSEGTTGYVEPVIKDYGTFQELTRAGGGGFHDVPAGAPVTAPRGPHSGSTP